MDERRELIYGVTFVPELAGFFRSVHERSTVTAEGASGEEFILAECGENLSGSAAEGTSFKSVSHG